MRFKLNKIKKLVATLGAVIFSLLPASGMAFAEGYGITMSPMNQVIILTPGEKYTGAFTISNDLANTNELQYNVAVQPFFVDDDYNIKYEEAGNLNQIVNWTTTDIKSGTLHIGSAQKINFTIDVPKDAPAGGQYEAIIVSSVSNKNNDNADGDTTVAMNENIAMAHIIYAEIAGTTRHSGEVLSTNMPSFIFDGNISAESTLKNTGNTHGVATYTMQVFPLFSNEEVFTNEENPETKTILPDRALINKTIWDKTPPIGIFNVKYTVEFEGVTTEVNKLVIKCPLWLLAIIIFVIIAIITWLVVRAKGRKADKKA